MIVMCNKIIRLIYSIKLFNRYSLVAGILVSTLILISCEKKIVSDITTDNEAKVTFRVAGVNNSSKGNVSKQAGSNALAVTNRNDHSSNMGRKIQSNISLNTQSKLTVIGSSFDSLQNSTIFNKVASTSFMPSGRKFRIVILDLNNNIVKTVQASVDKGVSIDLEEGQQYKWYAYSYNDEQDIPVPTNAQIIETPTDKDLLYAKSSSSFTVGEGQVSIDILFEHQLAMLSVELDYHQLYATIPANSGDPNSVSDNLNWSFVTQPNFLYKGTFSLTTGEISNPVLYTANLSERIKNHQTKENTKVAECYYVTPPPEVSVSNNFTVSLNTLSVQFYNSTNSDVIINSPASNTFSSLSNVKGQKYVATMKLRYQIPKKLILHVTATDSDDDHKMALAAQPYDRELDGAWDATPTHNRPAFNMIKADRNYGILDNSIVYTEGFDHIRCSVDGKLDEKLTIPGQIPDIVILSVHYAMDSNDITELINYLNNGGVLIMLTAYNGDEVDRTGAVNFMRALFNNSSINYVNNIYPGGSLFEIDHFKMINDRITNGPFGDLRGKYWGVDYYNVIQMTGIPSNMVTSYSNPSADNHVNTTSALSMFKHNSLDFFWIGNGSFLSGPAWNLIGGWNNESVKEPFATVLHPNSVNPDPDFDYDFYPMPKLYGVNYYHKTRGYVGSNYQSMNYNAPLFSNLMSWALYRSEFYGVNRNN